MAPAEVKSLIKYDPETGVLSWAVRRGSAHAGKVISTISNDGYIVVGINRRRYQAHRVAWVVHYGEWPDGDIDHINGDRADNRISNLRLCDDSQNQFNVSKKTGVFTSSYKGVGFHSRSKKWRARIRVRNKRIELGYFDTQEEAYAAYCEASKIYHGEYGRV